MAALAKVLLINSKNVFYDRRSIGTFVSFACMPFCFLIDSLVIEKIIGNLNYYNFSQVRRSMTKTGSIHFGFFFFFPLWLPSYSSLEFSSSSSSFSFFPQRKHVCPCTFYIKGILATLFMANNEVAGDTNVGIENPINQRDFKSRISKGSPQRYVNYSQVFTILIW
jgi:hypothetical protein